MKTISEMIIDSIVRNPDRIAVVAGGRSLTYREVGARCKVIVRSLIKSGIDNTRLVAIVSDRSSETYCQVIACLVGGIQYTTVEMEQGTEAWKEKLAQISPFAILAPSSWGNGDASTISKFSSVINLDCSLTSALGDGEFTPTAPVPSDIAYVLYTSGSTGTPKGVQVTHSNVYHYTKAIISRLSINSPLSYAHISTLAADLGNTSLFMSPATGGTLHLIDDATKRDPLAFLQYLQTEEIDVLKITPSHWRAILSSLPGGYSARHTLNTLVLGGEELKAELVASTLNAGLSNRVFNHYGPTETTVGIATFEATEYAHNARPSDPVPIGNPLGDTKVYVEVEGQYQSSACEGELLVTGPSVSLGYRNMHSQTHEKYIYITVGDEQLRAYRTGDIVQLDANGCMTFIGRSDRQVKISGYRVELAEIERDLIRICEIDDCLVHYISHGEKNWLLAAYTGGEHDPDRLREVAAENMQNHMLPAFFHQVETFPRNANGKSDLRAVKDLLEHALKRRLEGGFGQRVGPVAYYDIESIKVASDIRSQFSKILGQDNFDDRTDFFAAGGNSLDGVLLVASLQLMGYPITGRDFIEVPNIKGLTEFVAMKRGHPFEGPDEDKDHIDDARRTLSAAQKEFVAEKHRDPNLYLQTILYSSDEMLCERSLNEAVNRVVTSHGLLTTSFACGENSFDVCPEKPHNSCFHIHQVSDFSEIEELTKEINASICLKDGNVFGVHYIKSDQKTYLYLVAHHLVIDVISWRIVINEISAGYLLAREGKALGVLPTISTFWQWTESVERVVDVSAADSYHRGLKAYQRGSPTVSTSKSTEGNCETFWLALSFEDSIRLDDFCRNSQVGANVALLGIFVHAWVSDSVQRLVVDVESHGRFNASQFADNSRLVGWHTSTYPIGVDVSSRSVEETIFSVNKAIESVPRMGIDISWAAARGDVGEMVRPAICYNFLGDTDFPFDQEIGFSQDHMKTSEARSFENTRQYEIKVSVQLMSGQYVVDISYPYASEGSEYAARCERFRGLIAKSLRISEEKVPLHITSGTSTGQISFVPKDLRVSVDHSRSKPNGGELLVTGATGYIGIYFVRQVLIESNDDLVILARAEGDVEAKVRFAEIWQWYFPEIKLERFLHRISFKAGDVSESLLGLSQENFDNISRSVRAIFNFAADIRLFASEHDLEKVNVRGVENLIYL